MREKRDEIIILRTTKAEKNHIYEKMLGMGIRSLSAYIRKMALDGYCLNLDLPQLRRMAYLLQMCSNNLNQYAKAANENGRVYAADMEDLRQRLDDFCAACPQGLRGWLEEIPALLGTQAAVLAERASGACITAAGALAAALPGVFLFCGTTALAVFFTTGSYPRIMAFFRRQLGTRLDRARGVKANLLSTLGKWFRAQAILLGVTFCELLAGFLLMGQRYALLLAAVTALVDALPVFGTGTVLLPWAAACLLLGQAPRAVALAALYAVISAVRSFLEPKVMAAQAGLPPLAALAAMYAGFRAFGVAGMILLPVALLFVKQLHDQGYVGLWK